MMAQGLPVEAHERDNHEQHLLAHDQRQERVDVQLQQIDQIIQGGEVPPQRRKLALEQHLLLAHDQSHMREIQKLTGQGQQAGSPIAENLLRGQLKADSGSETQAEIGGQPLSGPEGLVQ